MKLTTEDILAVIGEEKIKEGLKEQLNNLKKAAAEEYARYVIGNDPDMHVKLPDGKPHPGCACVDCCEDRLSELMSKVKSLETRLDGAKEALVSEPIQLNNRASRRRATKR